MNCSNCGAPLREGAQFCARCGAPVQVTQPAYAPPAPQAAVPNPIPQQAATPNPAPQQPRTPFVPAQRTADRVFPSQQRGAMPQPNPPAQSAPGAAIDWERLQPRAKPLTARALIWAAAILGLAAVLLLWATYLP